jgi:2-polyprenyl-3-methyl-5-hydroxy-6-metoxy-1,4-benzoquinol methylase
MPLAPNLIERTLFLQFNQAPAPILDIWSGPAFYTILSAIRLGLFASLQRQPATPGEVAARLQIDPRGAAILLETLRGLHYVQRQGERFANSAMTTKWLTDAGEINLSAYFQYWGVAMERLLPTMTESLRTGQPPVNLYEWLEDEPEASRFFQEGMIALTRYALPDVLRALDLPPGATQLLDVGGGHAFYSIGLCQKYPGLKATILDGAQALVTGQETIAKAGLTERITTRAGNFLADDLGSGYDAILLFNIVHGLTPASNLDLLRKCAGALKPGGRVYVLEQIAGSAPLPLMNTGVQLLSISFYHLLGGQVYALEEMQGWFTTAGLTDLRRKNITKAGSAILAGTRADR